MTRSDVPWYAALFTVFGAMWAVAIAGSYNGGGLIPAVIAFAVPIALVVVWSVVKAVMFRILFPK